MTDMHREAFEGWVATTAGWKACKQRGKPMHLRQNADGSYNDFRVNDRWVAWQAAMRYRDKQARCECAYTCKFCRDEQEKQA